MGRRPHGPRVTPRAWCDESFVDVTGRAETDRPSSRVRAEKGAASLVVLGVDLASSEALVEQLQRGRSTPRPVGGRARSTRGTVVKMRTSTHHRKEQRAGDDDEHEEPEHQQSASRSVDELVHPVGSTKLHELLVLGHWWHICYQPFSPPDLRVELNTLRFDAHLLVHHVSRRVIR